MSDDPGGWPIGVSHPTRNAIERFLDLQTDRGSSAGRVFADVSGTAPVSRYLELFGMKKKIFNVLFPLGAAAYISTYGFQDIVVMVVVVGVGFRYLQQHDQIAEQRAARHADLVTRLDRWQQDVKSKATQSSQRRS